MVRVTNGYVRHKRHKKFRKAAKGFRLGRKNVYKQVRLALIRRGQYAYTHRKTKKRDFRKLWIERIGAAAKQRGGSYSFLIGKMGEKDIRLNRKVLSNVAIAFPEVFDKIYKDAVS